MLVLEKTIGPDKIAPGSGGCVWPIADLLDMEITYRGQTIDDYTEMAKLTNY
jgi:hypothetical protein